MVEGIDSIVEYSSRTPTGYPARRMLEVTLEIISDKKTDIKTLFREVRSVVFSGGVVVADDKTIIKEVRTEGPTGYGLPGVLGIRLILFLMYKDEGI